MQGIISESTRPASSANQTLLNVVLKQAGKKTFSTETIVLLQRAIGDSRIQAEKYGQNLSLLLPLTVFYCIVMVAGCICRKTTRLLLL